MLGFIHITKTGGTNIKDKNKNNNIIYGAYHYETALTYKNNKMTCFAIIRNPIDRYISLFYYNTQGSNKYAKKDDVNMDINTFVCNNYVNKHLIDKYENGMQFKKQVEWLEHANANNTFLVMFSKNNLINNITEMCKYNGINFIYDSDNNNKINVTNYKNSIELTEDSKNKIVEMYADDYKLYNKFVSLQKPFCTLSEIYA